MSKVSSRSEYLYTVFRVMIGVMFFMHGSQKLLGWFGMGPMLGDPLMIVAGVLELVGGLAIALGFWSRLAALGDGILMVFAYFMAHFPKGYNPLMTGGELPLLYLAGFLVVLAYGNGKNSLEQLLLKKETF